MMEPDSQSVAAFVVCFLSLDGDKLL